MEAMRRGLDFPRRTRSSRRHPMSDRIAGTSGITSRQPTTFGPKIRNAIGAFGFEIAFLFWLRSAFCNRDETQHSQSHCTKSVGVRVFYLNRPQQSSEFARSKRYHENGAECAD